MGKKAFIFPGQGSQFCSMGASLVENNFTFSILKQLSVYRNDLIDLMVGTDEQLLNDTENAQPCIFAMEMSLAKLLESKGVKPDMCAGFSLGELSAVCLSGMISLEDCFKLVCARGKIMHDCSFGTDTFMSAVVKLDNETVRKICSENDVFAVNFNCPGQISVTGYEKNRERFSGAVKEAGGRVIPIKVSGPFHSPLMKEASEKFGEYLCNVKFKDPEVPVYSNCYASVYSNPEKTLEKQICNPVLWEDLIRKMIVDGAETFIEIGPGNTLSGFLKKTDSSVKCVSVSNIEEALRCCENV